MIFFQFLGHSIIIDQIKERELKRLREKEDQEREGQQILKEIKVLQKEETENIMVLPQTNPLNFSEKLFF